MDKKSFKSRHQGVCVYRSVWIEPFSTLQAGRTSATWSTPNAFGFFVYFQYPPSGSNLCNRTPFWISVCFVTTFSTLHAGRTPPTECASTTVHPLLPFSALHAARTCAPCDV